MMNTSKFPVSPRLSNLPEEKRTRLLATCYAFYALTHNKYRSIDTATKVNAHVMASFPVWQVGEERQKLPPGYSFEREIGGSRYFFRRTQTEFAVISFSSQDDRKVANDAAIFAHLNLDDPVEGRLLSTFNVSVELLTQISLILSESVSFPRILMVEGMGQAGLLLTTNHGVHKGVREHLVFSLPELSFGKASGPYEQFRGRKQTLSDFVLSCEYSMQIENGRGDEV